MKQMSYVTRWLYSTSHKDIAILYLGFGMISAMVGTGMSVIIRMELSNGNSQFFHGNNQAFNVIVTGHAIAMIFLFVMPVLIGAFGNFYLPIMIGAVDMAFARLNNISFWCLPPGLVCIICSVLIEQGAGTGWTVNMPLLKISFDAWITFLYLYIYIWIWIFIEYSNLISSVKMSINLGQYACVLLYNNIHQRLNMIKYRNVTYRHYNKDNKFNFKEWLVGFTDGDGTFNIYIDKKESSVSFTFKISQNKYNHQLLYFIKSNLNVGQVVTYDKNMVSFILRDKKKIEEVLFPIFDKYYLLSSKYFNYMLFKESILISNDINLSQKDKILKIKEVKNKKLPKDYTSPIWKNIKYTDITSVNEIYHILTKNWLVGFIEAEGSFFYTKKSLSNKSEYGRLVHSFGLTQKLDPIILYSIKHLLHITNKVIYKSNHNYYILETSNSRSINYIIKYFITNDHKNLFKGMKSFEFNLWKRTFLNHKNDYDRLYKLQQIVRKLKKND